MFREFGVAVAVEEVGRVWRLNRGVPPLIGYGSLGWVMGKLI